MIVCSSASDSVANGMRSSSATVTPASSFNSPIAVAAKLPPGSAAPAGKHHVSSSARRVKRTRPSDGRRKATIAPGIKTSSLPIRFRSCPRYESEKLNRGTLRLSLSGPGPNIDRVAEGMQREMKRLRGQIIRSGIHGEYTITREAVEGMLEQIEASPKPVNIEHDPTRPPVGRMVKPKLIELPNGEVALETETELFDEAVSAVLKSARELEEEIARLPGFRVGEGPLGLTVDPRSYRHEDIEAIRGSATVAGEIEVFDNAMRFSVLPDALLVIGLGAPTAAAWWFSKGFFTKLGEMLGEAAGDELASSYRAFKAKTVEVVERREPRDRPPITM